MDDQTKDFSDDKLSTAREGDQHHAPLGAKDHTLAEAVDQPQVTDALLDGSCAGRHPPAETLVKVNFILHDDDAFLANGLEMARTDIVGTCMAIAEKSMISARDCMAREVQIEANILPIAVGVGEVHLKVSILLPDAQVDPEKAEVLRTLGRLAKFSLDGALEIRTAQQSGSPTTSGTDAPSTGGVAVQNLSEPAAVASGCAYGVGPASSNLISGVPVNPFDQVAAGLVAALDKKKRPGEITITVSTGDDDDEGTPFTVAKPADRDGGHVTFVAATVPLILTVGSRISSGLCEVKEAGASCRVRAKFGTSGLLPLQLRFMDGGHPVTALVRRRSGDHAHGSREPAMYIERLLELDEQWGNDMGGLETFRQVLESLRALLPKTLSKDAPPTGKRRR